MIFSSFNIISVLKTKRQENYVLWFNRVILLIIFGLFFSLQLGIYFKYNQYLTLLIPSNFLHFIFYDYYLWSLPYIFFSFWLIHIMFYTIFISLKNYFQKSKEVNHSIENVFIKNLEHYISILILEFPLAVLSFNILLWHSTNDFFNSNVIIELYDVFKSHQSLLSYTTYNTPIIILSLLLIISFLFFIKNFVDNILPSNFMDVVSMIFTFVGLFFVMLLLFLCNNLLLLIFLFDCIILLLLNLIRLNNFSKDVDTFLKSILIFLISQVIATIIFCYGLYLIYLEEPSLNCIKIANSVKNFYLYFFETHQNIMQGSIYLILGLLIKMGLGPLGLWILSAVNSFSYPFLALYFSFIKPLYFLILTKMLGNTFSTLYTFQGFIAHPTRLHITDTRILEFFRFLLNQSLTRYSYSLSNIDGQLVVLFNTDLFRERLNLCALAFSFFSVIIGVLGLLWTTNFKKFIVFSSLLQYGLILYLTISGYPIGIHFLVMHIAIYSFINIIFIWLFNYLTSDKHNSIVNLTILPEKSPILSFFLGTLVLSMAGVPPFIGCFTKCGILLELVKILGGSLGSVFILFTFVGAFGYARILKNMYYGFNYTNVKLYSINFKDSIPFFFVVFFFLVLFIINTFCGFYINILNTKSFTTFNSFVFTTQPHFHNNIVYHYYSSIFLSEFNIDAKELVSLMKDRFTNDPGFFEQSLNHQTNMFIEKRIILTRLEPNAHEIEIFQQEFSKAYRKSMKTLNELSAGEHYADFCRQSYKAFSKK
jgi:NADH:ubiquinone oxidoreductase subunit 2 (subunit N)